jgi:hypothetical protein
MRFILSQQQFNHQPYVPDPIGIVAKTIEYQRSLTQEKRIENLKGNLEFWEYWLTRAGTKGNGCTRLDLMDEQMLDLLAGDIAAIQVAMGFK